MVAAVALLSACTNATSSSNDAQTAPKSSATTYAGSDFDTNEPVDAPGVSSTEIHVGSVASISNPVGGDYGRLNDGIDAYFDFVNAQGGVWGRTLKLTTKQDDNTVDNLGAIEALLGPNDVYAAFMATQLFTGAPKLAKAGIPTFGWNVNPEWAGPEDVSPNVAPYCFKDCSPLNRLLPWVLEQTKSHRVAMLAYNIPIASDSIDAAAAAVEKFGSDVDANVVYKDTSLQFGQTDYSAQVAEMKQKGADFLLTGVDANANYAIAQEMQRQGILDDVTLFYPDLYQSDFVSKFANLFEGAVLLVPIAAVEHQPVPPAVQEYLDYAHAHDLIVTQMTEQGWAAARQFVEALKAAGPNFTWANLVNAWNRQTWFTNGGFVWPIDWTRQHGDPSTVRSEFECGNFVRVHDGKFVPIWDEGGEKPWVCFDGTKPDEWQQPVNVSFVGEPFDLADVASTTTP